MQTASVDAARRLSEIAVATADASALDDICSALAAGQLQPSSTAAVRSALAQGRAGIEDQIRLLQREWALSFEHLSGNALAIALRIGASAAQLERLKAATTQLVWTGPTVDGSYFRATREVLRELIRGASRELLVVGYWLGARAESDGIIQELIELLADSVERGVVVTIVLDERQRENGRDNRAILLDLWRTSAPLPRILTWKLPADDRHLKLHAKVIVSDCRDALVTSANLTWHAMDRNIEMGVRVLGRPAEDIAHHFRLLALSGVLEPYVSA